MTTNKNRLAKLEKASGAGEKKKYLCVIVPKLIDSPEEQTKGYKVQPCTIEAGGEPFYIATRKELDEFAARPDVDLDIIEVVYASEAQTPSE